MIDRQPISDLQSGDPAARPPVKEPERMSRRRRELALLVATLLAALVFIVVEMRMPPFSTSQTLITNVFFFLLINLNIVLILVAAFLIGRNVVRLVLERRQRVLGSQLRTRLVVGFVGVAIVPAMALFLVALGFIRSSMEGWFTVQVENALEGSLDIADTYYREVAVSAQREAVAIAARAKESRDPRWTPESLRSLIQGRLREFGAASIEVVARDGTQALTVTTERLGEEFRQPVSQALVAKALQEDGATAVEPIGNADIVFGVAPLKAAGGELRGAIVVRHVLPKSVGRRRTEIDQSYRQYKQVKLLRRPIINNYVLTLVLAMLAVTFGGIWIGFAIAKSITGPIQALAEATREVAEGNLDQQISSDRGSEELSTLVSAFNQMTVKLRQSHLALAERRRTLETLLANITAGVVSIDGDGHIETINPAARAMLRVPETVIGMPFRDAFPGANGAAVRELLTELESRARESSWERLPPQKLSIEDDDQAMLVLATGVVLRGEGGRAIGGLLLLEDVTELLRVQRMEAWREVARRIAHEIKNPLTPIQLSAQRLRKRYATELGGSVLDECTKTIIAEVEVLKNLVSEFAHFARLPAGQHRPTDLNELVDEVLVLFREAHRGVRFVFDRGASVPILELDRDGIRRVLTNILDNAVAALRVADPSEVSDEPGASGGKEDGVEPSRARGYIEVVTRHEALRDVVVLEVADDGTGMTSEVKMRLFEPYFSTKPTGTGLGLAIASAVLADHQAFIRVKDNQPRGSRFVIEIPVREGRTEAAGRRAIG